MNKKLPDPKVGRKSQNMAVKESDKMVILVPHNVKADEVIMLSDNQPSYDFSELAKLISNADVDRINKELIEIYYKSLSAQGQERQPDHKMTNRGLQRFYNSTMALSTRALYILAAEQRKALEEFGLSLPPNITDDHLYKSLVASSIRATVVKATKPRGPRGIGAQTRFAFSELIELYCRETGSGKPYKANGEIRRLESAEFAVAVLKVWLLKKPSYTPKSLAAVWLDATR